MDPASQESLYKTLPAVDELIRQTSGNPLPHTLKRDIARSLVMRYREHIRKHGKLPRQGILDQFQIRLQEIEEGLQPVINATGVILHTGLGRAPLSRGMLDAAAALADRYTNLELDLASGRRGDRHDHLRPWIRALTGAEDGILVNNNAAAVLLLLNTLADGHEVIASRGQQVEIGGSFRIPGIIRKAGARLVEVGTTNRTHARDYEEAITARSRILLWVHTSNYRVEGFTSEVPLAEMVEIAHNHDLLCVADLGSGALLNLEQYELHREPLVAEVLASGVDAVTFSVDKLLGGPQGGIVAGRRDLIRRIQRNNLLRALRPDKLSILLTMKALEAYGDSEARELPLYRDLRLDPGALEKRLRPMVEALADSKLEAKVVATRCQIGSGASPLETLPSRGLQLQHGKLSVNTLARRLRLAHPPILGRIEENRLILDLRTVRDDQDSDLIRILKQI